MGILSFLEIFRKDSPAVGDVHVASTIDGSKRKKKPGDDKEAFETAATVLKVDTALGIVMGWAIVCKKDGADYVDLQDDHIPEAAMLAAAVDFMQSGRVAKEMHSGEAIGSVVFAFPMTTDIAKAFHIETATTGLMIAMKPTPDVLAKFADGTFTGFSIGGHRIKDEIAA